jgi:NAD(P)H dehydrogenase (quinone)
MHEILVLYYSKTGATEKMAKRIAHGVEEVKGAQAKIRTVPPISAKNSSLIETPPDTGPAYATLDDIRACDGLIIGSPTRFGNMSAELKHFIDQTTTEWLSGSLIGKPAAAFTSTSSMHGGQETTLLTMMMPLLHHGMLLVGLPYSEKDLINTKTGGTPYGASHVSGENNDTDLSDSEISLCKALGKRVSTLSLMVKKNS